MARSGHDYDDRTGIAYEYPAGRYEKWIRKGDRFVYQVPRVGYVGCGIIGDQRLSLEPGRIICDVESVRMFDAPVGLKSASGGYFEADPAYWRDKVYWGQGVRPLSDVRFADILAAADMMIQPSTRSSQSREHRQGYASPETARAVEDYSVAVAREAMARRFGAPVCLMPRNNPGFDLLVGSFDHPLRYVEVKGTQASAPVFFMSEGERQFSVRNKGQYTLFVVSGISLVNRSHSYETTHDGAVSEGGVAMSPSQWRGQIVAS